jgi:hypothetical protein
MLKTIAYLDSLPVFDSSEQLPVPWLEITGHAIDLAAQEFLCLVKEAQTCVGLTFLPHIQFDERLWAKPSHAIGSVIVCSDETYLKKTHQPTLAALREFYGPGCYIMGLALEVEMLRRYPAPRFGNDMYFTSAVYFKLSVSHGREMDAFREIHFNYRGIIGKLLELGQIGFFMSSVIPEVEAVPGKKTLQKLDAVLNLKDPNPDDHSFDLEYAWRSDVPYQHGLRAFLVLGILFTCIQKASASTRSRRDDILNMWNSLKLEPIAK